MSSSSLAAAEPSPSTSAPAPATAVSAVSGRVSAPSPPPASFAAFSGFFKRGIHERRQIIYDAIRKRAASTPALPSALQHGSSVPVGVSLHHRRPSSDKESVLISDLSVYDVLLDHGALDVHRADSMIENAIGVIRMPLGVSPNFLINGKHYVVPFAIEEPSVVAASAAASKTIAEHGGFHAQASQPIMTGQVQILFDAQSEDENVIIPSADQLKKMEEIVSQKAHQNTLIEAANAFVPSMVRRGGGVVSVELRAIHPRSFQSSNPDFSCVAASRSPYLSTDIHINVCDAMGANAVNSLCESFAPTICKFLESLFLSEFSLKICLRVGLRILTNYCQRRMCRSKFEIPIHALGWKGVDGEMVAQRILEAFFFAVDDLQRATTNNKGIFNGIDAVAIATGQDWRALEAAGHAHAAAARNGGVYGPLAHYAIREVNGIRCLVGEIELPIAVGTVGGAISSHPLYSFTHSLLGHPNAAALSNIIASVGLAQNFAAIRALAVEGIQKGHMGLHARNVALAANVPDALVSETQAFIVQVHRINQQTAAKYFQERKRFNARYQFTHFSPSALFIEVSPGVQYLTLFPSSSLPSTLTNVREVKDNKLARMLPALFKIQTGQAPITAAAASTSSSSPSSASETSLLTELTGRHVSLEEDSAKVSHQISAILFEHLIAANNALQSAAVHSSLSQWSTAPSPMDTSVLLKSFSELDQSALNVLLLLHSLLLRIIDDAKEAALTGHTCESSEQLLARVFQKK